MFYNIYNRYLEIVYSTRAYITNVLDVTRSRAAKRSKLVVEVPRLNYCWMGYVRYNGTGRVKFERTQACAIQQVLVNAPEIYFLLGISYLCVNSYVFKSSNFFPPL